MCFGSLPSVSEAAPSSARFARSGFISGGEYFLVNLGQGIFLDSSGAGRFLTIATLCFYYAGYYDCYSFYYYSK